MDLDAYRQSAETFTEELMREYYRHHAGLQDSFEIESIYARHADRLTIEVGGERIDLRRFGRAWFDSAEAGEVLRGLWRDGQRLDAEELLVELTGERLDFGVVLTDLGLG